MVVVRVVLELGRADLVPRFDEDVGAGDEVVDAVVLDELVLRVREGLFARELQFEGLLPRVQDLGQVPGDGAGRRFV